MEDKKVAEQLECDVRDLIRVRGIDPQRDPMKAHTLIGEAISSYDIQSLHQDLPPIRDVEAISKALFDRIVGFGPLQPYLDDDTVEEIWLNSPSLVFVSRLGVAELTNTILTQEQVEDLVERMLRTSGRRLDLSSPFVDASLPTGERLHVVIPDVTRKHWAINIRKYIARAHSTSDLVQRGSLTKDAAEFLNHAVESGMNVLVSGATNSGKTTMINALAGAIPSAEHVVTCEEVFELNLLSRDIVAMQTRSANLEGYGEVGLRRLVKEALRMRPDRLIIGEVRGGEALDLLIALNSGIPGMATIHANSAREAITKICTLPLLAGENITDRFVIPTAANAIDVVVHLGHSRNGKRFTQEIVYLSGRVEGSIIESSPLFVHDGHRLQRSTVPLPSLDRVHSGINPLREERPWAQLQV